MRRKRQKLRTLDAQVLKEMCLSRSNLHSAKSFVPSGVEVHIELNIRSLDQLIPKLRERKRV